MRVGPYVDKCSRPPPRLAPTTFACRARARTEHTSRRCSSLFLGEGRYETCRSLRISRAVPLRARSFRFWSRVPSIPHNHALAESVSDTPDKRIAVGTGQALTVPERGQSRLRQTVRYLLVRFRTPSERAACIRDCVYNNFGVDRPVYTVRAPVGRLVGHRRVPNVTRACRCARAPGQR